MPNFFNFKNVKNVKTIRINPKGWINPLYVEYGISDQIIPLICWRVKGTKHTFTIPPARMNYISSGNYDKHFTEVLEIFKESDYDKWREQGFQTKWMQEYEKEYRNYIL